MGEGGNQNRWKQTSQTGGSGYKIGYSEKPTHLLTTLKIYAIIYM